MDDLFQVQYSSVKLYKLSVQVVTLEICFYLNIVIQD